MDGSARSRSQTRGQGHRPESIIDARGSGGGTSRSRKSSPFSNFFGGRKKDESTQPSSFTERQQSSPGSQRDVSEPRSAPRASPNRITQWFGKSKPTGGPAPSSNYQQQHPQQQQQYPQQQQQQYPQQQQQQQQQQPYQQFQNEGSGGTQDVKELQHRIQVLSAQQQGYDDLQRKLKAEQGRATEWREKWNHQDFKLNLMVDMLVLRVLETEGLTLPTNSSSANVNRGSSTPATATATAAATSNQAGGSQGNTQTSYVKPASSASQYQDGAPTATYSQQQQQRQGSSSYQGASTSSSAQNTSRAPRSYNDPDAMVTEDL